MFRYVLRSAYKHQLLAENIYDRTSSIREHDTHREFLTIEEFQKLASTKASSDISLTGMRFSDIKVEKPEKSTVEYYVRKFGDYPKGLEAFVADLVKSDLPLSRFVSAINLGSGFG